MAFLQIRFTRSGVVGIGRNPLREIGRRAMYAVGYHWWKMFLPIHFQRRALNRYHYTPRQGDPGSGRRFKGSYAEAKVKRLSFAEFVGRDLGGGGTERAIGENKPYVFTGRSRELALSTQSIVTKAPNFRDYQAEILINAPALNYISRTKIDVQAEMRRTTAEEDMMHERIFAVEFEAGLNAVGRTNQKTITIRSAA